MKAKAYKLLIVSLLLSFSIPAQNSVPNYSFEDTLSCALPVIYNAPPWFNPTGTSPDYWNEYSWLPLYRVPYNGFGYQPARTGHAYAGIGVGGEGTPNQREYIEVMLDSALVAGKKYCVQFYVNLADSSGYATDGMGAYLSIDTIKDYSSVVNLPYTPQISNSNGNILTDKINWVLISGEYIASGGEKFITIGNFKDDANSQTQYVGPGGVWLQWCYYFIEDVYVGECDTVVPVSGSNISIPNIFSPNNDGLNDVFRVTCKNILTLHCKIYDRWGLLVGELKAPNEVWQGRITSGMEVSEGVYYYVIEAKGEDSKSYNETGFIQLIR